MAKGTMLRQWIIGGIMLATGATCAAHAATLRDFPTDNLPVTEDRYPERTTAFPDGITGYADVVYSSMAGFRPLVVDIYAHDVATRADKKPLILYIHGGGWIGGHTRHSGALSNFPKALAALAAEGFVVASLEYRLSGEAPFPAQIQDARAAIRFLKKNADKYGIDASRVGVWGGSAGGHLTALTALSCGVTSLDAAPAPTGSECVQAAVTWYGVYDFAPMIASNTTDGAPNKLLGCKPQDCPADAVKRVSPISYIDAKDPPMLLIHGEDDAVVPVSQSRNAEQAMKAAGMKVESLYIPAVDHSFIGKTPAITHEATNKAMNATFDFFHRTLGVSSK